MTHEPSRPRITLHPRRVKLLAAGVAVAAIALVGFARRFSTGAVEEATTLGPRIEIGDPEVTPWCASGLDPIAGGGCLALPAAPAAQGALILYLHGMYEGASAADEMDRQRRVAARATARGFAVLALRSELGVCRPGIPEFANRYCWPSNELVADRGPAFVASWQHSIDEAQRRMGAARARYVLGFSSGGYFAALLAARNLFSADAVVIAHGGPVEPIRARPDAPPILLLSADDDVAQAEMLRLDDDLSRVSWPHEHTARGGVHGLTDGDIDVALTFLTRVRTERLPLRPPLAGHRPRGRGNDPSPVTPPDDEVAEGLSEASAGPIAEAGGSADATRSDEGASSSSDSSSSSE